MSDHLIFAPFTVVVGVVVVVYSVRLAGSFFKQWCGFQFHTSFVLSVTSGTLLFAPLLVVAFVQPCPDTLVLMAFIIFSLHVDFCAAISQENHFVHTPHSPSLPISRSRRLTFLLTSQYEKWYNSRNDNN